MSTNAIGTELKLPVGEEVILALHADTIDGEDVCLLQIGGDLEQLFPNIQVGKSQAFYWKRVADA